MNIFEEAAANRQYLTITQENLTEFKQWLNNSKEPSGYSNFSLAEDVPLVDIVPDNHNDEKKIDAASYIILKTLYSNENRIKECFDLASAAPQIPATVYYLVGRGSGNMDFYDKLGETLEARPMSDNLAIVAHNTHDLGEWHLAGQKEDIRTLSPEKRKDLDDILDVYTRYALRNQNITGPGAYNKIRFAERIFGRGDLLNYNGLSTEQRKLAVSQFMGQTNIRISELLARLDEKYLTVDLLKDVMMGTEKVWDDKRRQNVERKYLKAYINTEFELSEQDKRNHIGATYRPKSSGEYALKDTSKAKTQAEKNVNILPDDYKRIRDFLIKESQKRNKNSANAGFQSVCCELYGVKSFNEIPEGSIIGLLADVNIKTAQHDIANGNAKNLSVQAMQLVLDTDKDGYYTRQVTQQDIDTINRYSNSDKVQPNWKTKGIMDRDKILKPEKYEVGDFTSSYVSEHNKGLTGKEKQAILARSEVAFKADTIGFRLEMEGQSWDKKIEMSRNFAILASDAVQQKKDFTPEQKTELKKLTGQDYSAQDILNILDMRYEDEKQLAEQRVETYKKVEAVREIAYRENKSKTTVNEKIEKLQTAYQEIQKCSKNQNFEAKDEEPYKPENVEQLISAHLARCISSGMMYEANGLSEIEKPSFMGSMFAPRKEEQRQKLNYTISIFNQALTDLTRDSDWDELKKYDGKMLSPETKTQSQHQADNAKQNDETIKGLTQKFFYKNGHDDVQAQLAEQIFTASPQPLEKLELKNYINEPFGQDQIKKLDKMAEGEKIFGDAKMVMAQNLKNKKQAQEEPLAQEAQKQARQKAEKAQARTRATREKLRAKGGNNTLLEQIDTGIKAKEQKRASEPKTFDKLAIKEALKRKQLEP